MKPTVEDRFWRKVEKTDGCWKWLGNKAKFGHGWFWDGTRNVQAHRFSYHLHHGTLPDDLCVCHSCDNPWCVRPEHLWLGTRLDNMRDARDKGRLKNNLNPRKKDDGTGEQNSNAKLSERDVIAIRLLAKTHSRRSLAVQFGVSHGAISHIVQGTTWRHIS